MKVSKAILAAMALGLSVSSITTGCEKVRIQDEMECHVEGDATCDNDQHQHDDPIPQDCPTCGMG